MRAVYLPPVLKLESGIDDQYGCEQHDDDKSHCGASHCTHNRPDVLFRKGVVALSGGVRVVECRQM